MGKREASPFSNRYAESLLQSRTCHARCRSVQTVTNDASLVREEAALTSRANGRRDCSQRVCANYTRGIRRSSGISKFVAALGSRRKNVVNDVYASRASRTSVQFQQCGRVADIRATGCVGYFARVDRTDGTNSRGLIGGHLGLEQVWNCDGRDDQNDRHDDQQLDKRETLLLLHAVSLENL